MSLFTKVQRVHVLLDFGAGQTPVGRLAANGRRVFFEYEPEFLKLGLELSPWHLPLQTGLFEFEPTPFEGLCGVFADSLPDGWGRLLLDRYARSQGVLPAELGVLERLTHVGLGGPGALVYVPDHSLTDTAAQVSLDQLSAEANHVLAGDSTHVLKELLLLNGSSAGARPKAQLWFDVAAGQLVSGTLDPAEIGAGFEAWLVKFAGAGDLADAGALEYTYALLAKQAGVDMQPVHLFEAQAGAGYFGVKRFDREGSSRLHLHSAAGLLHADFRAPSLDYSDLLKLGFMLTKDAREVLKLYRMAVFNVLAHNRDDHAKNFSFLMDATGQWRVAPAYDLTFSSGPGGEQSTLVMGEGKAPGTQHLLELAAAHGVKRSLALQVVEQTRTALAGFTLEAKAHGVSAAQIKLVSQRLAQVN